MNDENTKTNIKINLSKIYSEKELEQIKKLIPNLSTLIFTSSEKSRKLSNVSSPKAKKVYQFIEKDKFVKIILDQILNLFKSDESEIISKSLYYLLNDNNNKSVKEIVNKRNSEITKLTKNHIFVNLAEKTKNKGDNIFKQKKSPNKKILIDNICNTELRSPKRRTIDFLTSKKYNKVNNLKLNIINSNNEFVQSKRDKKIIDYNREGDKTEYNNKNVINNSLTFTAIANPEKNTSKIQITDFPIFCNSNNSRRSDVSSQLFISKTNKKSNKIYFPNQLKFQNNHHKSLKMRLSPFTLASNKSYERKKANKELKKFSTSNKSNIINHNINSNSNDNIKKIEKLKTEMNKEKKNPINRNSVQQFTKNITFTNKILKNNKRNNNKNINKKISWKTKNINLKSNLDKKEIININLFYNESIESKDFDIFNFENTVGKENTLPFIGSFIFKKFDFSKIFKYQKFNNWSKKIAEGYLRSNPYHNDRHAADVTQTCFLYLLQEGVQEISKVDNIDICILIVSSMCHDFKHPGVNNNFLKLTKDKLALRYNDISILENMHIAQTFKLINKYPECDIFSGVDNKIYEKMRKKMISCVLATDMANHSKHLNFMKNVIEKKENSDKNVDNQEFMNLLIHSADISNPTKPFDIYLKWAKLVVEEFFIQGDKEKELGLVCTCDRTKVKLNNNQIGFIDYVVKEYVSLNIQIFPSLKFTYDNLIKNREIFVNYKEDNKTNDSNNKKENSKNDVK